MTSPRAGLFLTGRSVILGLMARIGDAPFTSLAKEIRNARHSTEAYLTSPPALLCPLPRPRAAEAPSRWTVPASAPARNRADRPSTSISASLTARRRPRPYPSRQSRASAAACRGPAIRRRPARVRQSPPAPRDRKTSRNGSTGSARSRFSACRDSSRWRTARQAWTEKPGGSSSASIPAPANKSLPAHKPPARLRTVRSDTLPSLKNSPLVSPETGRKTFWPLAYPCLSCEARCDRANASTKSSVTSWGA